MRRRQEKLTNKILLEAQAYKAKKEEQKLKGDQPQQEEVQVKKKDITVEPEDEERQ